MRFAMFHGLLQGDGYVESGCVRALLVVLVLMMHSIELYCHDSSMFFGGGAVVLLETMPTL
jgi:hypothetical protein